MFSFLFKIIGVERASAAELGGLEAARKGAGFKDNNIENITGQAVAAIIGLVGVIFLILMIYGGFIWMTAQGDEKQVEQARNLIVAGIIGLLIIFVAYAVTSFMGVLR